MSEEESDTERQSIAVEFPLDSIHEPMVSELDETDVDVRDVIARSTIREVEQAIYQTYQTVKYQNINAQ